MYTIVPTFKLFHEARPTYEHSLVQLFQDSHLMFNIRFQNLINISRPTSLEDSETLRVMLEALIIAKSKLKNH